MSVSGAHRHDFGAPPAAEAPRKSDVFGARTDGRAGALYGRAGALYGRAAALYGGAANGSAANGSAANGGAANGSAANGSAANGSTKNGAAKNGSTKNGTAKNGTAQRTRNKPRGQGNRKPPKRNGAGRGRNGGTPRDRNRPLYARALQLRNGDPNGLLSFVLFEGMIALATLMALAELVNWWAVPLLPLVVAGLVKINDIVAGIFARGVAAHRRRGPAKPLRALGRAKVRGVAMVHPLIMAASRAPSSRGPSSQGPMGQGPSSQGPSSQGLRSQGLRSHAAPEQVNSGRPDATTSGGTAPGSVPAARRDDEGDRPGEPPARGRRRATNQRLFAPVSPIRPLEPPNPEW